MSFESASLETKYQITLKFMKKRKRKLVSVGQPYYGLFKHLKYEKLNKMVQDLFITFIHFDQK
ncbi:hypothetical protein CAP47_10100 [Psychroflexus sp. S27]|nr:hypothetical protein CAP47_10100 [Psychroflexus sp. S27]